LSDDEPIAFRPRPSAGFASAAGEHGRHDPTIHFSREVPLYRIEKCPSLARRQGAYSVVAATGLIMKRGHDLSRVLDVLDRNAAVRLVAV
jgi:hypothetical protein